MTSPRVSLLLSSTDDIEIEGEDGGEDYRTPLDKTIDRIGMGNYQWALLSLCGFGWAADNMWLQAVAIILPRVQDHYLVSDHWIGALSACMFAGMMIGAVGWGTCSDLLGRSAAFNLTLCFTSAFGLLASFVNSFPLLCLVFFLLGTAVGGSMPTDGTLLLESLPQRKQYLLTFLSIFFSVGAVLAALVAIIVIPSHSCLGRKGGNKPCDVEVDNMGWRHLLRILGIITLVMFICRIVFFRLHESPRYLVSAGRKQEAVVALKKIAKFNGREMPQLNVEDVDDVFTPAVPETAKSNHYQSTSHSSSPPSREDSEATLPHPHPNESTTNRTPSTTGRLRSMSTMSTASAIKGQSKFMGTLPAWIRRPLRAWMDRIKSLLTPEWRTTTLLVWSIWTSMALAYTMFNVFLPMQLEARHREPPQNIANDRASVEKLKGTMWEVVVFTLGGCPGSVLGAYLIETPLGRRRTLALSTFLTAIFCILFALVRDKLWIMVVEVGVSLAVTTMWAVLYGMTPEIFATEVRGTAVGTASALSRIGGILAPLVGGPLFAIDPSVPVFTSVVIFLVAVVSVLALSDRSPATSEREGYQPVVMH